MSVRFDLVRSTSRYGPYSVDIRPWTLARRICSVGLGPLRLTIYYTYRASRTDAAALSRCTFGQHAYYWPHARVIRFILKFRRRGLELGGWKARCLWLSLSLAVWLVLGGAADQDHIRFLSRKKRRGAQEAKACETERFRMLGFVIPADRNRTFSLYGESPTRTRTGAPGIPNSAWRL